VPGARAGEVELETPGEGDDLHLFDPDDDWLAALGARIDDVALRRPVGSENAQVERIRDAQGILKPIDETALGPHICEATVGGDPAHERSEVLTPLDEPIGGRDVLGRGRVRRQNRQSDHDADG
jgi:hypothetical protein